MPAACMQEAIKSAVKARADLKAIKKSYAKRGDTSKLRSFISIIKIIATNHGVNYKELRNHLGYKGEK